MRLTLITALALASVGVAGVSAAQESGITTGQRRMMEADVKGGVRSLLAPGAGVPKVGSDGTELDYLRWAKQSLSRGQDAEAELSLEWGQLRRRVDEEEDALRSNKPPPPYDETCERMLCKAMRAIGSRRDAEAMGYLDAAIDDVTRRGGR